MSAKTRARETYVCESCGATALQWMGQCPSCEAWDTLARRQAPLAGAPAGDAVSPLRLSEIDDAEAPRVPTGIAELDRVLGGGLVPGSLVLLGGEPGIGKSTLALQVLGSLAGELDVLLVTGEESPRQVRGRARRIGPACDAIAVLAETRLEAVISAILGQRPTVCVIDSVQTLMSDAVEAGPGSVPQVRQATAELMRLAKSEGVAIILIGQVTKDGALAGPRTLEHLVDCVLTFESAAGGDYRLLRAVKNRFGSVNETGTFEMCAEGLVEVDDPSGIFLSDGAARMGSCVYCAVEGTRVVPLEIEALVTPTSIVPPRRAAVGIDKGRLAQVIAVLTRHAGLSLGDHDIFVSVAGGAKATDPASDLAIALAIASAHRGAPLAARTAAFGELGLTGAVRPVSHVARRLAAAETHGMDAAVVPVPVPEGASALPERVEPVVGIRDALAAGFAAAR